MSRILRVLSFMILLLAITPNVFAQDEDDSEDNKYSEEQRKDIDKLLMPPYDIDTAYFSGKKKSKQQNAFLNDQYYYPAKPKNPWELGFQGGILAISGDTKPLFFGKPNGMNSWGVSGSVRKAFGYFFSLRAQYVYGRALGMDYVPSSGGVLRNNSVINGLTDPTLDYSDPGRNPSKIIFMNYKTEIHELSLQGVLTIGNMKFHRERSKVNLYLFGGGGIMTYRTWYDFLDENGNMYDWTDAAVAHNDDVAANGGLTRDGIKNIKQELFDMLDGEYETDADDSKNDGKFIDRNFLPIANVGIGIGYRISRIITINVEGRVNMTFNDAIDGNRWSEFDGLTEEFDTYSYSFISLNFNLMRKSVEPLYWMNPMDYTYKKLAETSPERIVEELIQDDDEDGVPNKLDKDPNTPPGVTVDTHGVPLDSDKDGIPDFEDEEPFSPSGYEIGPDGRAIMPEGMMIGPNGMVMNISGGSGDPCLDTELPRVHFDLDKYYIRPEYYSHLHEVAILMLRCEDKKIVVTGHTDNLDSDAYNEKLSWNRAMAVIDFLTSHYDIARDRFYVEYKGESEAIYPDLPESKSKDYEYRQYQNRRVEFRIAGENERGNVDLEDPHPDIKAGEDY